MKLGIYAHIISHLSANDEKTPAASFQRRTKVPAILCIN